jgi:hypothetical protein
MVRLMILSHSVIPALVSVNGFYVSIPFYSNRWQLRTPAVAAGLTDHVWSLREVLMVRAPP